jgi:hypothetical protein
VTNQTTSQLIFDGCEYVTRTGQAPPQRSNVVSGEGLQFSIQGPEPDWKNFIVTANANGPLDPPDMGTFAFNSSGFPSWDSGREFSDRPSGDQQVGEGAWGIQTGDVGSGTTYSTFLERAMRSGFDDVVPYDFEIRFTEEGGYGFDAFVVSEANTGGIFPVPFELWNIGIGTPDDSSDDYRLIPYIIDWDDNGWNLQDFDHGISGGTDDPESDWIYWRRPEDTSPGTAGYDAWEAAALALPPNGNGIPASPDGSFSGVLTDAELIARMVLVNWNGGDVAGGVYDQDLPEVGTVFRLITAKPNQVGDSFTLETTGLGVAEPDLASRLDEIGIVPNPYKGASAYEVSQLVDEVRFTNMPTQATIRVFTVNGTLLRTMVKNSPELNFSWDLTTEESLPLASGMYLVHVEVPNVGEKVIKFGVVKKRISLNAF